MDAVGIAANLFQKSIIAFMLYKSSKQINKDEALLDTMIIKTAL